MRSLTLTFLVLAACSGGGGGGTAGGTGTAGGLATAGGSGSNAGGSGSNAGGSGSNAGGSGSNAGGSGSNAGGSGSTAGGSGATAGGSGATAGGTGSTGGIATFLRVGLFDKRFVLGSDGRMHFLFNEGAAERVVYASCQSGCSNPASWNPVQIASAGMLGSLTIGAEGLGIDSTGRLHALFSGVPMTGNANRAVYATCASGCSTPANWSLLDVTPVALDDTISTESTVMVTPSGQVSFVTRGGGGAGDARYVVCNGSCTTLGNWSAGQVLTGQALYAMRDASGVTHVLYSNGTTMQGDNLHFYARCASACTTRASWQLSPLGFIYGGGGYNAGFAVTDSGRVYLAYNQGVAMASTADNRKLFINSCQTPNNCLDLNTWSSFSVGALDEGDNGAALVTEGDGVALVSTDSFDLKLRDCSANCGAAASWSMPVIVDNSMAVGQVIAPDTGSACPGASQSAAWWPSGPVIAGSSAKLVIAHSPYSIVKCPQSVNPSRLPPIGRVITTF